MRNTPRTEFAQAIRAITTERGLDPDVILEAIEQAIVAAYKRDAKERGDELEGFEFEAKIDKVSGETKIYSFPEEEPNKKEEVTPPGFGRIAAQTAKQVIHQKIREAEKGAIMDEFSGRVGSLISGIILSFDGPNVRVDVGRTEAVMPAEERIPNERLNPSQRMTFLLKDINDTPRGKRIILSRAAPDFVTKLFEREVPEISSGSVEVKGVAREPGGRTKIAVFSNQQGVDPVGSCVGQKGVRVQSITNELGGERVDIVPWSEDQEEYIKAALSPVEVVGIKLTKAKGKDSEDRAVVTVPEEELSVAIGQNGQNVRLASQLTKTTIDVEGTGEGKKETKKEDKDEEKEEPKEEKESKKEGKKKKTDDSEKESDK